MWSENHAATKDPCYQVHSCRVSGVADATPCHYTGYDWNETHILRKRDRMYLVPGMLEVAPTNDASLSQNRWIYWGTALLMISLIKVMKVDINSHHVCCLWAFFDPCFLVLITSREASFSPSLVLSLIFLTELSGGLQHLRATNRIFV